MATKKTHFTLTEAAKKLGISRQAVHKAIEKGTLKARRIKVVKNEWQISATALRSYSVSDLHQSIGKKIADG
jgi:excisionase family DNA binding protein